MRRFRICNPLNPCFTPFFISSALSRKSISPSRSESIERKSIMFGLFLITQVLRIQICHATNLISILAFVFQKNVVALLTHKPMAGAAAVLLCPYVCPLCYEMQRQWAFLLEYMFGRILKPHWLQDTSRCISPFLHSAEN